MAGIAKRVDLHALAEKEALTFEELELLESIAIEQKFDFFVHRVVSRGVAYCLEDEGGLFLAIDQDTQANLSPVWPTLEHACLMQRSSDHPDWRACAVVPVTLERLLDLLSQAESLGDSILIGTAGGSPGAVAPARNIRETLEEAIAAFRRTK